MKKLSLRHALVLVLGAASITLGSTGCHKPHTYQATVEITRASVVRRDENGRALTTDIEFSYIECPGTQIETVRGGQEFATCVSKHPIGAKVPVKLDHKWDPEGHYAYEVTEVGGCARPPDPNDEASFATIRECEDLKENGAVVGFDCQIAPKKELLKKCPWFGHH